MFFFNLSVFSEDSSKPLDQKLKLQQQESSRRENVLVMRLASKEQEMQELVVCLLFKTLVICKYFLKLFCFILHICNLFSLIF